MAYTIFVNLLSLGIVILKLIHAVAAAVTSPFLSIAEEYSIVLGLL